MQQDNLATIHEIRKAWQTNRSAMYITCQKINELEEQLAQARAHKRQIQQNLTTLEIEEKSILGEIKTYKPAKTIFKTNLEKAITTFVNKTFSQLSKPEKATMIETMLKETGT